MSVTLLLNATYQPLCVVPTRRAVILVMKEKAEVIEESDAEFRSASTSMKIPSVIRLVRFVRVPYRSKVVLTNRAVLKRDNFKCQYCGGAATTVDHVLPRSRGGRNIWTNVVAACKPCNTKKSDKLLSEIGWSLPTKPVQPVGTTWLWVGIAERNPEWETYLGNLHVAPA